MNNMRRNNRPKYYEAGGLLEMLTRSSPTMSFEQRARDQVARDLLRNETEEPPRMMLYGGGLAALRRASGGMIPGYAFGGSMAGAYGGSPMKAASGANAASAAAQPFGQKGGGWGSTPTAPAQTGFISGQSGGKSQFLPAGGCGSAAIAPAQMGGKPLGMGQGIMQQQLGRQGPPPGLYNPQLAARQRAQSFPMGDDTVPPSPADAARMQPMAPQFGEPATQSNTYGLTQAQIGRGQRQIQQMSATPQQQQQMQQQNLQNAQSLRKNPSLASVGAYNFGPGTSASAAGGGSRSDPFLGDPQGFEGYLQAQQTQQLYQAAPPLPTYGNTPAGSGPQNDPSQAAPPSQMTYQAQPLPEGYGSPTQYAGYGGPESFGSRQEFVSPEVASQYADLTDSIMAVGTKPYEKYEGQQLADFTGMEEAAQGGFGAYGTGEGPQGTRQAESTLDEAASSLMETGVESQDLAAASAKKARAVGETATALGSAADMTKYMSDYTQNVTDPQLQQLMEFQKQQGQELGSQAAGAGAFGGYRQGIMQGQQAQDASQQAADIIGRGQQEAFQSAVGREKEDARRTEQGYSRKLAAEGQAASAEAAAQNQMLSASRDLSSIGQAQTTLGERQQAQTMQRLTEMQKAGASQRQLEQARLDMEKRQWEQEQQRPERQTAWMNQQLGQLPYQNIVQQGSYSPQAGPISTAIGAGVQGAGLWQAWQAKQKALTSPTDSTVDLGGSGWERQETNWTPGSVGPRRRNP